MSQAQITELEKRLENKMRFLADRKTSDQKASSSADKLKKLAARLRKYEADSHSHVNSV